MTKNFTLLVAVLIFSLKLQAQIALTGSNPTYNQNFNTLDTAAGSAFSNIPPGWEIREIGSSGQVNNLYRTGIGSSSLGDTYGFGAQGNTDRAFGTLLTATITPQIGVTYQNNSGLAVSSISLSYRGEQWRRGNATIGKADTLHFQYSLDADSLGDALATWISVPALRIVSPNTGAVGALDGNTNFVNLSASFNAAVPNGAKIMFRWMEVDITGSDDGLSADDISVTFFNDGTIVPPAVAFLASTTAQLAESAGNSSFAVNISNPQASTPYSVKVVLKSGNPVFINNYSTQTLNFGVGVTSQNLNVTVSDNTFLDGNHTFVFALRQASFGSIVGTDSLLTLTVVDNEGPVILTGVNPTYAQNFNTLYNDSTGTSMLTPQGWMIRETGTNSNTDDMYRASDGNTTWGDTRAFRTQGSTECSFGMLQTATLHPQYGVMYLNNTGAAISSVNVNFNGEQWRRGNTTLGKADTLQFQFSVDADSLNEASANWTSIPGLRFTSPNTGNVATGLDGNTVQTSIIGSFNVAVPNNGKIMFRWLDVDLSGTDDGLAADDLNVTFFNDGTTVPTVFADFTPPTLNVSETSGITSIPVQITGGSTGFNVQAVLKSGNPAFVGGFSNQTLNFPNGNTSQNINLNISDNTFIDGNHVLVFALRNPSFGLSVGNDSLLTLTIIDNEGPIILTGVNPSYAQNFNTLNNDSTGISMLTPQGWTIRETGTNANVDNQYRASDGNTTWGDTRAFRTGGSTECALGSIQTATLNPNFGAAFLNNTGTPLNHVVVNYRGEQWRRGNTSGIRDSILFRYSMDADSLNDPNASWFSVPGLDFGSVNTSFVQSGLDGNNNFANLVDTFNISVLPGAQIIFSFVDLNISGSDDGLAIDNFNAVFGPDSIPGLSGGGTVIPANPDTLVFFEESNLFISENSGNLNLNVLISSASAINTFGASLVLKSGNAQFLGNFITQNISFAPGTIIQGSNVSITDNPFADGSHQFVFALRNPAGGAVIGTDSLLTLTIADNEGPILLTGNSPVYSQDFNGLLSVTPTASALLPLGWYIRESGVDPESDHLYKSGNGTETAGNAYSYGTIGNSERALGTLRAGNLNPMFGADFVNLTGTTISSIGINYRGEQWRRGNNTAGFADSLLVQYSITADSLTDPNGIWIPIPLLNFASPNITGTLSALDGNVVFSDLSTGFNATVATGARFMLRWTDKNISGTDDGLAADNVVITFNTDGTVFPTASADFGPASNSVIETAGTVGVGITLSQAISSSPYSINVVLKSGNAANVGAYTTQTLNFAAGVNTQNLTIPITDNLISDGTRTLVFALRNASAGLIAGQDSLFTLTITDNELIPPPPFYTIGTVRGNDINGQPDSVGVHCQLSGAVYGVNFLQGTGLSFFINDKTGGIQVFNALDNMGYNVQEGDSVLIEGTVSVFKGQSRFSSLVNVSPVGPGNIPTPQVVTALNENTEGELIRINNLTITNPAFWNNSTNGFEVFATDGVNNYKIRVETNTSTILLPVPNGTFDIIGIGAQSASGTIAPFSDGYLIMPRKKEDIMMHVGTENEIVNQDVSLFPNPNSGSFNLTFSSNYNEVSELSVFDVSGRKVFSKTIGLSNDLQNISLETGLASGTYILRINSGNQIRNLKFVVR